MNMYVRTCTFNTHHFLSTCTLALPVAVLVLNLLDPALLNLDPVPTGAGILDLLVFPMVVVFLLEGKPRSLTPLDAMIT